MGGNSAVGGRGNSGGGGQQGVVSTSKNRTSHHKYKSPKQFELKESRKAQEPLMLPGRYLFNLFLRTKASKASDKKLVTQKIA